MERRHPRRKEPLATICPEVAAEWHPRRNGTLTPSDVTRGSSVSAWWCCSVCGHDWKAIVFNRSRGRGCPECGKRSKSIKLSKPRKGESLADLVPGVAALWHPIKNGDLSPSDVKCASNKKVWWRCSRFPKHIWQSTVAVRVKFGPGCPRCSNQTSEPEIRIFAELSSLFRGVQSRCRVGESEVDIFLSEHSIGVEFDGAHWHRGKEAKDKAKGDTLAKKGVTLIRVRQRPLRPIGQHDVVTQTRNALTKKDIDELVRKLASIIGNVPHKRINEYLRRTSFVNSALHQRYCAYLPGPFPDDSLASKAPLLAAEFCLIKNSPLTAWSFAAYSNKRVWWKCGKCGRRWIAQINNRMKRGLTGCRLCNRTESAEVLARPLNGRSLSDLHPEVAAEWHPVLNSTAKPQDYKPGSNRTAWWRCSMCGEEWKSQINHRSRGHGCKTCGRKRAARSKSTPSAGASLADLHPAITDEWHPAKNGQLKAFDVKVGSNRRIWWKCRRCSHEWLAAVAGRVRGTGCPICGVERSAESKRTPQSGASLADRFPAVCDEWHPIKNAPLTPTAVKAGSSQRVWWRCTQCSHEYIAAVTDRTQGRGCRECGRLKTINARRKPSPGMSLADLHPLIAREWHPTRNQPLAASDHKCGSHTQVWWQCGECHNEWRASINKRVAGRGCPACGRKRSAAGRRRPRQGQSLADLYPSIAAEWHSERNGLLRPGDVRKTSLTRVWWKCGCCNHEWQTPVGKRTAGHGCRMCAIDSRRKRVAHTPRKTDT